MKDSGKMIMLKVKVNIGIKMVLFTKEIFKMICNKVMVEKSGLTELYILENMLKETVRAKVNTFSPVEIDIQVSLVTINFMDTGNIFGRMEGSTKVYGETT